MSSKFEVFVSHDSADETLAILLKKLLEGIFLNAEVFVSGRDLRGGNLWAEELKKRLGSAKAIIALITRYSENNVWVHFESGVGFVDGRTIPVCVDGIRVETLVPPLKLLQARNFDKSGLTDLLRDISKLADTRSPETIAGLDKILTEANRFIQLREVESHQTSSISSSKAIEVGSQNNLLHSTLFEKKDEELKQRLDAIKQKYQNILRQKIQTIKSGHHLPSRTELDSMNYYELDQVLMACKAPTSPMTSLKLGVLESNLPVESASKWRKMNAMQELDDLEKDLQKIEKL